MVVNRQANTRVGFYCNIAGFLAGESKIPVRMKMAPNLIRIYEPYTIRNEFGNDILPGEEESERQGDVPVLVVSGVRGANREGGALLQAPGAGRRAQRPALGLHHLLQVDPRGVSEEHGGELEQAAHLGTEDFGEVVQVLTAHRRGGYEGEEHGHKQPHLQDHLCDDVC